MASKDFDNSIKDVMGDLLLKTAKAGAHKKGIVAILIKNITSTEKVKKIRLEILKYRADDSEEPEELPKSVDMSKLTDPELDFHKLDLYSHMLETAAKPIKEHNAFLNKIGIILKSGDNDDGKVTQLENLIL